MENCKKNKQITYTDIKLETDFEPFEWKKIGPLWLNFIRTVKPKIRSIEWV